LTPEYLLEFYKLVLQHPDIMKHITDEIHITARAKAGGKLKGRMVTTDGKEEETGQAETLHNLKTNSSQIGGKVIEATDDITVIPTVLMREQVTNGALKRFEEFASSAHWFEGVPLIGPHKAGDPPVSHLTKKPGKLRNVRVNKELRRVEAEAVIFNSMIAPDDLIRIKSGEPFGGSIGYYCDEEKLESPQTWTDGTEYNRIEKGPFFADHFSMVPNPACSLPHCGLNVNAKETDIMLEETKPAEAPKTNAETKPEVTPTINVAAPTVNVDLSTVLTEMKSMREEFATLKTNIADKDTKIATLEAAETIRQNAAREQAVAAAKAGFAAILNANAKMDIEKLYPEYEKSPALWIVTNTKLLDVKGMEAGIITPAGQPFVPHVNASDEDPYEAAGAKAADDMIVKKVA
jgi:hypothetical protein